MTPNNVNMRCKKNRPPREKFPVSRSGSTALHCSNDAASDDHTAMQPRLIYCLRSTLRMQRRHQASKPSDRSARSPAQPAQPAQPAYFLVCIRANDKTRSISPGPNRRMKLSARCAAPSKLFELKTSHGQQMAAYSKLLNQTAPPSWPSSPATKTPTGPPAGAKN